MSYDVSNAKCFFEYNRVKLFFTVKGSRSYGKRICSSKSSRRYLINGNMILINMFSRIQNDNSGLCKLALRLNNPKYVK